MSNTISTTREVIEALGGTKAVADLFGLKVNAVSFWRTENEFPAHTYIVLSEALDSIGQCADLSLWKFHQGIPAPQSEASAE